jgi:hypothetical protein
MPICQVTLDLHVNVVEPPLRLRRRIDDTALVELKSDGAAISKPRASFIEDPAGHIKAVGTAVEGELGFEACHFGRESIDVRARNIRGVRDDKVDASP